MAKIDVYNSVGGVAFFDRMIAEWRGMGLDVTSHEAVQSACYRDARGLFLRFRLRWRMYLGFGWSCWRIARRGDKERVHLVTTNPFFLPALIVRAVNDQGKTINLLYDLYPEALIHAGAISPNSWATRCCAAITRSALRKCAVTVFLGERLRRYAESTYGPAHRAEVIPVGADGSSFKDHPPQPLVQGQMPRILYCGQMGRMHDVETLLAAWGGVEASWLLWTFHAGGAGYVRLRSALREPVNVIWGQGLPDVEWVEVMRRAQVALVTVACGAECIVMPSKTYSALVAGQAILAICPSESDLADLVRLHDCGWVVEPGDADTLKQVLADIVARPEELLRRRMNAFSAGHKHYEMSVIARRWAGLLKEMEGVNASTI